MIISIKSNRDKSNKKSQKYSYRSKYNMKNSRKAMQNKNKILYLLLRLYNRFHFKLVRNPELIAMNAIN